MKISKILLSLFTLSVLLIACNDDDESALPKGNYENGILISNEGPYGSGSGAVTYISADFNTSQNGIYNSVNNEEIGNVLQSIAFSEESAYLIANNSNRLVKVNRYTFEKEVSTIDNLSNPRYSVVLNGKLYVTNWGDSTNNNDDFISVYDAETLTYDSSISVEFGPEKIIAIGNVIYVAHKGGWDYNNKISVIDSNSNSVAKTIEVGDVPNSLVIDSSNYLWVLCGGKPAYSGSETFGTLYKINTSTNVVDSSLDFVSSHPSDLSFTNSKLYFQNNGEIYQMSTSSSSLPSASILADSGYSVMVNNGYIYLTDVKDYASSGEVRIYNLESKKLENTISTGIIPGGVYFN